MFHIDPSKGSRGPAVSDLPSCVLFNWCPRQSGLTSRSIPTKCLPFYSFEWWWLHAFGELSNNPSERISWGSGTSRGMGPLRILSTWGTFHHSWGSQGPTHLGPISGILEGPPKCYGEFTRDDHSDTVYRLLKVFILAVWDHTQVFKDLGVTPSVHNTNFLKAETMSWHLACQLQGTSWK